METILPIMNQFSEIETCVELKPACVRALSRIFYISDQDNDRILSDDELNSFQDKDSALSPAELKNLFCVCPYMPWGADVYLTVPTTELGFISNQGYHCQLSAYLDIHRCLEHLGYLGYPILTEQASQTAAITVTREKEVDLEKRQTQRSVFLCKVIGPRGTGKTAFLQSFVDRSVLLNEVDVETEFLKASDASCDVACLMYDTSDPSSFDYCASIYKQHYMDSNIPCVLVASKVDLPEAKQFHGMTPAEFCYKHRLPPPLPFSSLLLDSTSKNIYTRLAWAATYPYVSVLHLSRDRSAANLAFFGSWIFLLLFSSHLNGSDMSSTSFWLRVALGSAVVAVLGFAVYRAVARLK
ncbi:hypothetical protein GOODEAATRI_026784 [Goodea atripinnis]|uniref:Mitochondrial Rho GTPase 1/3 EF hand associated type-1 domain-containing protein n=1 Tax=Goodea atripinnis TaxID=208336 RepID=A0ABV0N4I6_9TELE